MEFYFISLFSKSIILDVLRWPQCSWAGIRLNFVGNSILLKFIKEPYHKRCFHVVWAQAENQVIS